MANYIYKDKLESKRLITRMLTTNDSNLWIKFFEDKDTTAFLPNPDRLSAKDRAEQWIEKQLGRYSNNRYGLQALINKENNEMVGQCGLLSQEVDGEKKIEVGYHIFKEYWGRGYAPEAARLFIDFGFENDQTNQIISIIDINNIRSQKVAHKNGLKKMKQTKWFGLDVFIYQINKQ